MPKSQLSRTTGVSRRHGPVAEGLTFPSRFVGGPVAPKPAVATTPPQPFGDLSTASISHIARLAVDVWEDAAHVTRHQRGQATRWVLEYLSGLPGDTWQERWDASPVGQALVPAKSLGSRRTEADPLEWTP